MRRRVLVALVLALLGGAAPSPAAAAVASTGPAVPVGSPYAHLSGWVDPDSQAARAARRSRLHPDTSRTRALRRLASTPQFTWLGDWVPADRVREVASSTAVRARAAGRLPQVVVYALPHRDCGQYSAGGLDARSYLPWVRELAAGLQGGRAAVVVEPDGLALLDCLAPTQADERLRLLREAVTVLSAAGATVYLDAGHAGWHPPETMAGRLRQAGIDRARGVSLNVAGYGVTVRQVEYAHALARQLPGLHALLDTSRNGLGGRAGQWCNVPDQSVGPSPRRLDDPVVDALAWVKRPGESDGPCGRGEPPAGVFWVDRAVDLVRRSLTR